MGVLDHVKRLLFQRGAPPTDASYPEGKTILHVSSFRDV